MSKYLEVSWAKTHNLKNVSVKIPKNKMTVITWLSGSGKSSLAFNTIYSEWQKKYLESLSTYARMFIWWIWEEALVDEIKWLSPTISIDQKTVNRNPRSTVWTITEIYDYYKLIFLHIGERKCVKCNNIIKKDSLKTVIEDIISQEIWKKYIIKASIYKNEKELSYDIIKRKVLDLWFIRFSINNKTYTVNDDIKIDKNKKYDIDIVVDRLIRKENLDQDNSDNKRLKDSLELAFNIWSWFISIDYLEWDKIINKKYSNVFVCSSCGHIPEELDISSFSFNSHAWACPDCHWLGEKAVFLEEKIVNPNLTLEEWAIIAPWFGGNYFMSLIKELSKKKNIRLNVKYSELNQKEKNIILYWDWGNIYKVKYENESWSINTYKSRFEWVINTLTRRYLDGGWENNTYNDFLTNIDCPECNSYRLKKESLSVYIDWKNIWELSNMSVDKSIDFFEKLKLNKNQEKIVKSVEKNIKERLEFLKWVWLSYMTIARKANTLSGWESQRIRLATQIWTKLEWIIYVLDEPSIWLHPRDNNMLIDNLKRLRDIWNTLIIVEHDEDIMREADHIIDIWPGAWIHGWEIIASWNMKEIIKNPKSVTAPFLSWEKSIIIKREKRTIKHHLEITGASQNNLKDIDVKFPLSNLTVVTWVSGSGKSSLVNDIVANYLANKLNRAKRQVWKFKGIKWLKYLDKVLIIDQSAIWKTPRSNPATYTWVFTHIRDVFASTQESSVRWYWPWRFSFNTKSGRCNTCDWDWVKKIEMHFLPPVYVTCEECNWTRYNKETLQVTYKWKTISDILNMTIEEAFDFFASHPKIKKILWVLIDVWLSYIKLWQSSTTLSGWESQRIKLATELSKRSTTKTFYILDEPTTWLHFQDVEKLLKILHSLVDKWNTVLVIEHNMDVILNADYIIDIWAEWGDKWWELVVEGNIEKVSKDKKSYTAEAIKEYLKNN